MIINRANSIDSHSWGNVLKWATCNEGLTALEIKNVLNLFRSVIKGKNLKTVNKAEAALDLMEKAKNLGLDEWLESQDKEREKE